MFSSCECDQEELLDVAEERLVAFRELCSEMRDGCDRGCQRVHKKINQLTAEDESTTNSEEVLAPPPQLALASASMSPASVTGPGGAVSSRFSPLAAGSYCLQQERQHHRQLPS